MKPSKHQQLQQPKHSLSEAMQTRIKSLAEVKQEKVQAEKKSLYKRQEDEVMAMCYGPNWRTRYPGEPEHPKRAAAPQEVEDDYDQYEDYEDDPRIRKAS